ncbi:hypothetical protein D9M73_129210 [compost metagenome]
MRNDCGESGRSISTILGADGAALTLKSLTPAGPVGVQSPKRASNAAFTSASGRSLTTKILALSGRIQACWKAIRSSRVSAATAFASPLPNDFA